MADELDSILALDVGDLDNIRVALDGVNVSAERVSKTMTRTFASAIVSGRSFETVLKSLAESLARMALSAGLRPLQQGLSSALSSILASLVSTGGGGAAIAPFAEGGVVSRPVFFGHSGGLGLMGERGAEAIVPLSRGPDGRLGIAAGAQNQRAVSVTVNISTPSIESFNRSQVQIASTLARAVSRGRRGV